MNNNFFNNCLCLLYIHKSKYFSNYHLLISTLLSYIETLICFLNRYEDIKVFRQLLEAIDFTFVQ